MNFYAFNQIEIQQKKSPIIVTFLFAPLTTKVAALGNL